METSKRLRQSMNPVTRDGYGQSKGANGTTKELGLSNSYSRHSGSNPVEWKITGDSSEQVRNEEEETTEHLLCHCQALETRRFGTLEVIRGIGRDSRARCWVNGKFRRKLEMLLK